MVTLEFLITSLIVVLIPGAGVIYTVSTGLAQGRRASIHASLGCTLGIVPHLLATVLGLAAVMHTSAMAFQALRYAGVAYLFYLAIATWRDRQAFAIQQAPPMSTGKLVGKAVLLNTLNPKLTIFFLAFLPQFMQPASTVSPLVQMLVLSAIFMAMTFGVFVVYGVLAHGFRARVVGSVRVQDWLRRGFTATFAVLGLKLAAAER